MDIGHYSIRNQRCQNAHKNKQIRSIGLQVVGITRTSSLSFDFI